MSLSVQLRARLSTRFTLDVAFTAARGVTILFGESGSGKTTLLRCVAGLVRPDQGRIEVQLPAARSADTLAGTTGACPDQRVLLDTSSGIDIEPARRNIGFVFQHLALFPHLTAADNIGYGLTRLSAADSRDRVSAIAESFRIVHLLDRRPGEISGGERQRVGLARALVTDPDLLLLDEPLSALDHSTQSRIIEDLRRWNETRRIPILYVTHSQREVFALGERVLVLQDGSVVADGTPEQVMETPSREGIARLAGFENILDAVVVTRRADEGVMVGRLARTDVEIEVPLADAGVGGALRIAVRAGDILIATERPRGLSARNVIPGRVASLQRQGPSVVRAEVDVGVLIEVHVTPSATAALDLQAGRDVWLVMKTHSCHPVSAL